MSTACATGSSSGLAMFFRPRAKPSKPWGCRSKTLTPTPEPAGYCAGDVAGERGDRAQRSIEALRLDATGRRLRDVVDPDVEIVRPRRCAGRRDVSRVATRSCSWLTQLARDLGRSTHGAASELIDAGDQVVVACVMRAPGAGSGVERRATRYAHVWTVRDGQDRRVSSTSATEPKPSKPLGLSE